jgi:NAD(P)-dependent dehydrogenase (short-subunit alcohol dehydrogenase family)
MNAPPVEIPVDVEIPQASLAHRVVLVTGAGQGLGRAVALACAGAGATVALLGRKSEKLEKVYDAVLASGGPEPAIVPLDLEAAGDREFEALAQLVRRDLGRLDGLVHCASHFTPLGPLHLQSLDQWMTHLRVNLAAPFALTRACLPLLAAAPDGSVIFTSETHALDPTAYWGALAVSKSALAMLAALWADEHERAGKPRFHVVVPGPVATPQRAQSHPGEERSKLRSAETAARVYLYVLGGAGSGQSGNIIRIAPHSDPKS